MFEADTNQLSSQQKSPLNFVAEALWEDFTAGRPIDGGVAFEKQLRQCRLDGSLGSLQRLDKLLLYIRSKITVSAATFMHADKSRNLLWFIGFYAGKILAKAWRSTPNWLGRHEIKERYSHLNINENNPFESMALDYLPKAKHTTAEYKHLFFVLEPIGKVVFGEPEKSMTSVLGDSVELSLFDAVVKRMPDEIRQRITGMQANQQKHQVSTQPNATTAQQSQANATNVSLATDTNKSALPQSAPLSSLAKSKPKTQSQAATKPVNSDIEHAPVSNTAIDINGHKTSSKPVKQSKRAKREKPKPLVRQDAFTNLRAELKSIDPPATQDGLGLAEYNKAVTVLDKFDKYIAKSEQAGTSIDSVAFTPAQKQARMQALKLLNQSAQAGNTSAMLRLAIYYFLGEGIPQDDKKGFGWVQRAANMDDIRGQRQLSRLYYEGLGQSQDIEAGRYWLEKAADNGHAEAKDLLEKWHTAQTIMHEHRFDQTVDQRYIMLGIVLAIVVLIIFILV